MQDRPAGQGDIQRQAGLHENGRKDRVVMAAVMPVFAVVLVRVTGSAVIGARLVMMVMVIIVSMKTQNCHVFPHMPMQSGRSRPGKLERNDKHDDQDDEAAHAGDCTALDVFTKGALHILPCQHAGY